MSLQVRGRGGGGVPLVFDPMSILGGGYPLVLSVVLSKVLPITGSVQSLVPGPAGGGGVLPARIGGTQSPQPGQWVPLLARTGG